MGKIGQDTLESLGKMDNMGAIKGNFVVEALLSS
jgi:hypothetical protein